MADLFALQGVSNSGKTQTLQLLFDALVAKYPGAGRQVIHRRVEILAILRGVNGHTIGIESQGDPNSRLERSLQRFSGQCDIIFCACRTSGATVNWVNALSPPFRVHMIQKTRTVGNHAAANAAMVTSLMHMAGL